jgi:hypothetical protein
MSFDHDILTGLVAETNGGAETFSLRHEATERV